jgi:hypothetical protein
MIKNLIIVLIAIFIFEFHAEIIPKGFRVQELSMNGEVLMPEMWHFQGGLTDDGYDYVITEKKIVDGWYETGFRIQAFFDVSKSSDLSPFEVALYNRELFKSKALRILNECDIDSSGQYPKLCLETIEENLKNEGENFRIIYTFHWDDDLDMMVVLIFGTLERKWDEMMGIYNVMKHVTILDFSEEEVAKENDTGTVLEEEIFEY